MMRSFHKEARSSFHMDHNETLILEEDLEPGQECRVAYQGSTFTAVNVDHRKLMAGSQVKISKTDGIKLLIILKN
jgi:membrane protein implicated in regulation of membrane protease activity